MHETIDNQTAALLNREKNTKRICSELNNFIELKFWVKSHNSREN